MNNKAWKLEISHYFPPERGMIGSLGEFEGDNMVFRRKEGGNQSSLTRYKGGGGLLKIDCQ